MLFQIVGVTPGWFTGLNADKSYDVAIPLGCVPVLRPESGALTSRDEWWLQIWGRLSPGESVAVAEERLAALAPAILSATVPSRLDGSTRNQYLGKSFHLQPAGLGISNTASNIELRSSRSWRSSASSC